MIDTQRNQITASAMAKPSGAAGSFVCSKTASAKAYAMRIPGDVHGSPWFHGNLYVVFGGVYDYEMSRFEHMYLYIYYIYIYVHICVYIGVNYISNSRWVIHVDLRWEAKSKHDRLDHRMIEGWDGPLVPAWLNDGRDSKQHQALTKRKTPHPAQICIIWTYIHRTIRHIIM